ncbi:MAG: pilus assembly protein [Phycisphaerae bacterium]|nr:pilus assembly protein [Phycisphaerae bacterium]
MKTRGNPGLRGLSSRRPAARRGGAVVEMAVVTPLLLLMLFGIIEFGYIFMMENSLTNATREACRTATLPGSTDTDIRSRFQQAIASTGLTVTDSMIIIEPATSANPVVTVKVAVPYSQVTLLGILPSGLFSGMFGGSGGCIGDKTIGSVCSMRKEATTSS